MKKLWIVFVLMVTVITLGACQRSGDVLRVGMDLQYPPFETIDNRKPEGISVDIAFALGEYLGKKVEIVNTNFCALIPSLESGEVDVIISSMSITEERARVVDFSEPYLYFQIISLVNKNFAQQNQLTEDSTVEELLALENIRFIGLASQVSSSIPASYNKEVKQATSMSTAIEDVVQGGSDILLMSGNPVADARNKNPETTMIIWDSFIASPIGMALKKGNTELLDQINAFIATMAEEGGLYDQLTAKYDEEIRAILGGRGFEFYLQE